MEAMDSKYLVSARNKRCMSDLDRRVKDDRLNSSFRSSRHLMLATDRTKGSNNVNKNPPLDAKSQSNLKQEPAKELIAEIAVLELEVMHLEQHLLSLYRKAFDTKTYNPAAAENLKQPVSSQSGLSQNATRLRNSLKKGLSQNSFTKQVNEHSAVGSQTHTTNSCDHRSQSDLSYRGMCSATISSSADSLARALQSCHAQPLSFLKDEPNGSSRVISLAEYLGTNIYDHIPETPTKISEDMIRCMGAIYCKLSDPPVTHHGFPSSPTSSFSSASAHSPQYLGDMWSPHYRRESTLDARLINPSCVEGLQEFSGPYNTMVEVPLICKDRG